MRITYLVPWVHRLGGTERAVATQVNHLARRHTVRLLAVLRPRGRGFPLDRRVTQAQLVDLRGETPQTASGVDYGGPEALDELLAAPSESFGQTAGRAFNRLTDLELEYALRHLTTDVLVTTAPPLLTLAARFAPSSVLLVHQEHRASEHRRGQEQLVLASAARADALVSLNGPSRDWLVESLGSAAPRVEVIPDALSVARPPRSRLADPLVVTAGRLVPEKRHADLIHAFADVVARHPGWRLRIFGDGPAEDDLRALIHDLKLYNHVLLPGATPTVEREWSKASIGVLSSRSEGLGLSLLEAAAAGVPSVSYDSPTGPATVLMDGENGRLVPAGDVEALAEALAGLIDDESERRRLGEAARTAARRYAPQRVLPRWDALLEDLGDHRSRGARLPARLSREANRARETAALAAAWPGARNEPKASEAGLAALQASRPDLVEDAGRLWHRLERLPEPHVNLQALDLVVDALEGAGIDYFWMRSPVVTLQRVGVLAKDRGRVLHALAAAHGTEGVYVTPLLTGSQMGQSVLAGAMQQHPELRHAPGLRVTRYAMSANRTLRFGTRYGCDIDLWEDRGHGLEPCRPGVNADEAIHPQAATPTSVRLGGRTYRSIEVFTRETADDIDFPIDAVYTWVDGSDPAWQERQRAELERLGGPTGADAAVASRFRSRDELRYSLRSLALYAPWIRHVYLVTDRQVPEWLDLAHPSITVVDHTDIFPWPERLPIFNSHALESSLHHIDGLADHYLYVNDDVLFGRPTRPQLFFSSNGLAHFFLSQARIDAGPVAPGEEPAHFSARKNTRRLLQETFGRTITNTFKHTPIPQLRPLMYELEERFPEAFAHNATSKFRSHRDYSLASTLHHYYGYFTGRTIPAAIRYGYFKADDLAHHSALVNLLDRRDRDAFCVNDGPGDEVSHEEQERMLRAFFDAYLPLPSSFERADQASQDPSSRAGESRQDRSPATNSRST